MTLRNWSLVRSSPVYASIRDRWLAMLEDEVLREEDYQVFLAENAGFFFSFQSAGQDQLVSAKIRLGSDFTTDFVVTRSVRSYGVNYTFIEIESPHTPAYTAAGVPSSRLNTAVQQVQDWQRWLERNREEAKRLFPSKQFIRNDDPNFSYVIVIGRRTNMRGHEARRNHYARSMGISIRTFDYLTDEMFERRFSAFTWISRDLVPQISEQDNNDYSNPFWKAFSDPQWRSIVRNGDFTRSHFIANNLPLLMSHRTYNVKAMAEFDQYLTGLDDSVKTIPEYEFSTLRDM
jgi:Domain of unknown function (DUF4263)